MIKQALIILGLLTVTASATTIITINKKTQTIHVSSPYGNLDAPVSTAGKGHITPVGTFRPYTLERMHYSRKYNNSPMPYSVFFKGGYALHGTNAISRLGKPASHGCVRLHPKTAKMIFEIVRKDFKDTTIIIK